MIVLGPESYLHFTQQLTNNFLQLNALLSTQCLPHLVCLPYLLSGPLCRGLTHLHYPKPTLKLITVTQGLGFCQHGKDQPDPQLTDLHSCPKKLQPFIAPNPGAEVGNLLLRYWQPSDCYYLPAPAPVLRSRLPDRSNRRPRAMNRYRTHPTALHSLFRATPDTPTVDASCNHLTALPPNSPASSPNNDPHLLDFYTPTPTPSEDYTLRNVNHSSWAHQVLATSSLLTTLHIQISVPQGRTYDYYTNPRI